MSGFFNGLTNTLLFYYLQASVFLTNLVFSLCNNLKFLKDLEISGNFVFKLSGILV